MYHGNWAYDRLVSGFFFFFSFENKPLYLFIKLYYSYMISPSLSCF